MSASKNKNNKQRIALSISNPCDHHIDRHPLDASWSRHKLCVVIFGSTHCMQTVHLIISGPTAKVVFMILQNLFENLHIVSFSVLTL